MAWFFDPNSGAYVQGSSIGSALADVSDGPHAVAALIKPDGNGFGGYQGITYLNGGSSPLAGLSLDNNQKLAVDQNSVFAQWSAGPALNALDVYLVAVSLAPGTNTGRWYLYDSNAATETTGTFSPSGQSAIDADEVLIGSWSFSDFFGGWMGAVAFWEGSMTLAQMQSLKANWRTSDWWNNAIGAPKALVEMNVDPSLAVDLASQIGGFSPIAVIEDTGEGFDGWNFDGTGGGGALTITGAGNIASGQAIGAHTLTPGAVSVLPAGLASAGAIGAARLDLDLVNVGAIASAEAIGAHTLTPGAAAISPAGLASAEAIGTPALSGGIAGAGGIASGQAFGTPALSVGPVTISPTGIPSGEAHGLATIGGGDVTTAPRQLPTLHVG